MNKSYKGRQTVIKPVGGWSENTLYLIEVAYHANNPVHRALFYSGFLQDGEPCGYHAVRQITPYSEDSELHEVYYLKVIRVLATDTELRTTGLGMPPKPELENEHTRA